MNLFLIGFRGTGKTSVGRALARQLAWRFVDMDETIAAESGRSIAEMVRIQGWEYFREQERRLLHRLAGGRRQVVGTGGGVILLPDNVAAMRAGGTVIWLRAGIDTIKRRLAGDDRTGAFRPALTPLDPVAEIETLLAARTPLYQAAMQVAVDTDGRAIDELCAQIVGQLVRLGLGEGGKAHVQ